MCAYIHEKYIKKVLPIIPKVSAASNSLFTKINNKVNKRLIFYLILYYLPMLSFINKFNKIFLCVCEFYGLKVYKKNIHYYDKRLTRFRKDFSLCANSMANSI